jgi:hypothetical protein
MHTGGDDNEKHAKLDFLVDSVRHVHRWHLQPRPYIYVVTLHFRYYYPVPGSYHRRLRPRAIQIFCVSNEKVLSLILHFPHIYFFLRLTQPVMYTP